MTGRETENPDLPALLVARRTYTSGRLASLKSELSNGGVTTLLASRGCVYATGSMGRGDASAFSDLDLFIISNDADDRTGLTRLQSLKLQAALITASEKLEFPPFSGDGEYLAVHSLRNIQERLGKPEDDYTNTFTARMLLLLESTPILEPSIYNESIELFLKRYWRDFDDHARSFKPLFLINDIQRYWKVLCLNYEAAERTDDPTGKAKRRLHNYKLKHSRMLICYSAIIYLAWLFVRNNTVTRADAARMVRMTPFERLIEIAKASTDPQVDLAVRRALDGYCLFLQETNDKKEATVDKFKDDAYHKARVSEAKHFGEELFVLVMLVTGENDILRYLIV